MKIASKKFRAFLLIATFVALIICSAFAFITMKSAKAYAEVSAELPSLTTFKTLDGAQVRLTDTSGIRFRNSISKSEYDNLITKYGEDNVEFGTVLQHKETLGEAELTLKNCGTSVKRTTWSKDNNPEKGTETYVYNAVLINLLKANYTKEYVALGYVSITTDETTTTYYSKPETVGGNVRSPIYVATKAANSNENGEFLNEIIYQSIKDCNEGDLKIALTDTELSLGETAEVSATLNGVAVNPVFSVEENNGVVTLKNDKIEAIGGGTATITATLSATYGETTKTLTATAKVSTAISLIADKDIVTVSEKLTDAKVKYAGAEVGTFSGTTFNAVEMLSKADKIAAGEQTYTLTVEAKDGRTAEITLTYTGLNNTNFATTVNASNSTACSSKYYVLMEDITSLGEQSYNYWNANYVFYKFYGILDGQGYKITIGEAYKNYQTNCGLFFSVNGTIKNIRYENTAYANHNDVHGLFVCIVNKNGRIENSYIKVNYNGFGGTYPAAIGSGFDASHIENCIFEVSGNENASAFNKGITGTTYEKNCILIREETSQTFAKPSESGNRIVQSGCYIYDSCVDFIAGTNGLSVKADRYEKGDEIVTQPADEGTHYDSFTGVWAIDAENKTITLCGKTAYQPVAITLSADKDTVTVSEKVKAANVLYQGEVIGTFSGTTFNAVEMLSKSNKIAAGEQTYTLTVEAAGYVLQGEGVTVTYTGLNNENFATTVNASSTTVYSSTYYVLMEDITVLGTKYTNLWGSNYVYGIFYGILDGQGYKITKDASYTTTTGLFSQLFGTIKNVNYSATLPANKTRSGDWGTFICATQSGAVVENCYISVDFNGNTGGNASIFVSLNNNKITNCIFGITGNDSAAVFGPAVSGTSYITNCIVISGVNGQVSLKSTGAGARVTTNCYVYGSYGDFICGVNGYAIEDKSFTGKGAIITAGTEPVGTEETPVTKYSTFTGVWTIDATSKTITLCGKTAYQPAA